jgi:hypothetical protein
MPSTYTSNLGLELQADGENASTWGQKVNTIVGLIEDAISSIGSISLTTDASRTLTSVDGGVDEARSAVLVITSTVTLTATRSIIIPSSAKVYLVYNNTSGSQSITIKTSGGTGVTVASGKRVIVYCDGTDVHHGISELPATTISTLSLGTDLAVVDGGTGAGTASDARSNLGVIIGSHVQAWDAALDDFAGLTQDTDKLPYFNSTSSMTTTSLSAYGRSLIDDTDASTARTTLGLGTLATKSSISSSELDSDAVTTAKINADAVTGAEIADDAIDSEHYTDGSIDVAHLSAGAIAAAYPVGSIYMNASSSTNPNTLLGFGTWSSFGDGRVLLGEGGGYANGSTGGATTAAHTLTTAEMPAHNHINGNYDRLLQYTGSHTGDGFDSSSGEVDSLHSAVIQSAGGGGSHSHSTLQPYITVHMWKRTA